MNRLLTRCMIVIFVAMSLFVVTPSTSYACSCVSLTPTEKFEKADSVFVGTAKDIKNKQGSFFPANHPMSDSDANVFVVEKSWKGNPPSQLIVYDNGHEESCGVDFKIGNSYLVYAKTDTEKKDILLTSFCDGTIEASKATEVLAQLGDGTKPSLITEISVESDSSSEDTQSGSSILWIIIGVVTGVIVGWIWMMNRRRK
ncbi:hypothetical protein [Brevibacillus daliensis]|uniref:hypothetical protein n=1 Tax=Brevibacillus daliensis TaxID=2892995 RepID=UPI001E4AE7AD|nr:hypothetical protein [Brevibacillus daliensis]